jgi:hypothetical protein
MMESRQPANNEPKSRHRDEYVLDQERGVIVKGQRFLNIVSFAAMTELDPYLAEQIIDAFEDFMEMMMPALKANGIQEIFFNRRGVEADSERNGEDVSIHTTFYNIVTEKITLIEEGVLKDILLDVRVWRDQTRNATEFELATPYVDVNLVDEFHELATPDSD